MAVKGLLKIALVAASTAAEKGSAHHYETKSVNLENAAPVESYVGFGSYDALKDAGDDMHAVHGAPTADGGYVLVGKALESEESAHTEAFAFKVDAAGDLAWSWTSDLRGASDAANAVAVRPSDGALLVAGWRTVGGVGRRSVTALAADTGAELWTAADFGDAENSHGAWEMIEVAPSGTVVLSGLREKETLEEMWFKSYGNAPGGVAVVEAYEPSAFSSAPSSADRSWSRTFADYMSAKAARATDAGYAVLLYGEGDGQGAALAALDAAGAVVWGPTDYGDAHGEGTDLAVGAAGAALAVSGHGGADGAISGRLTKVDAASGARLWTKSYSVGGVPTMIYNECWGVAALADGGFALSCGAGIEEAAVCRRHEEPLRSRCLEGVADDRPGAAAVPPGVWLSFVARADADGDLRWQRVDSYRGPDDPARGDAGWEPTSSAAEWLSARADGSVVVVTDEVFGAGLITLGSEGSGDGDGGSDGGDGGSASTTTAGSASSTTTAASASTTTTGSASSTTTAASASTTTTAATTTPDSSWRDDSGNDCSGEQITAEWCVKYGRERFEQGDGSMRSACDARCPTCVQAGACPADDPATTTTTLAPTVSPTPAPKPAPTTTTTTTATAATCANGETWKTPKGVGCGSHHKKKCKKQTGCKWKKRACKNDKAKSCSKLFAKYDKKKDQGKMRAKDYRKLAKLCETKGAADIRASDIKGCPASCGTCPTPTPTTAGVGAVVGETTTTAGFEGGGAAKRDPCKKMKTKKRCHKKKNKQGKRKCSWNPRKEKCKLKKKKTQ